MRISLLCCIFFSLFGCTDPDEMRHGVRWDQEFLKRTDVGCPTAIFIAPNGVLQQCE
jgi:hypothetical protein